MAGSAERMRGYKGPAVLSFGFRPFFLLGALWAALSMLLWIAMLAGAPALPSAFDPLEWHVHALLYGYLPAVAAGFLLTAVPNWTGRLPVVGAPLGLLAAAWLVGRAAVMVSAAAPLPAALADLAFLGLLIGVLGREIAAGRNWRNLKVLLAAGLLLAGNAVFHVEAAGAGSAAFGYGTRIGTAAAILLISLVGGRIVPSFTRNWLARRAPGAMPAPMDRYDIGVAAGTGAALALWIVLPGSAVTGVAALAVGAAQAVRLARWAGWRSLAEPLVAVLHAGYAFVPLGFVLLGLHVLAPEAVPRPAALHAWLAGAIGLMTLAVMTRASLGHSGRTLTASPGTVGIYALAVLAALARVYAGFAPSALWALHLGAAAWIGAFGGFVLLYGPLLVRPRPGAG